MFLDSELSDKKGWGHSSIEQGINLADKIDVKNFLFHIIHRPETIKK